MKFLLLFSSLIALSSYADVPRCVNHHWVSKDFILFTGGERCNKRVAVCNFIGTRSEGWYSYAKKGERKLGEANCSADLADNYRPLCENIGTKGEGWQVAGNLVQWSKCDGEDAVCTKLGTKEEGWYSYKQESRHLIIWAKCSQELQTL